MWLRICLRLFVLNYLGVYASDCGEKPHCGINEVWDCLCLPRPTCDEPCGGEETCPLDPGGNCVKECICKPGYVRSKGGLCTHCTQCTQLDEDDCCDDEVYQECGTFCPQTCASRGEIEICTEQCVQGCFCRKGQVRDIHGTCVDPEECPGKGGDGVSKGGDKGWRPTVESEKGCGGDPNAHPGCGINCGRTCSTFKHPPKICPLLCILHGCDCNDGFVKDPNVGKCVKPEDCTPTCKENEVYDSCGSACPPSCNSRGLDESCTDQCVPGCFCKKGWVRANSGKCVKLEDCDRCVKNETYITCGSLCAEDCATYGDGLGCGAQCIKGCFCTKGYYRNSDGECVLLNDCQPKKCGNNEYFNKCGPDCEDYCTDLTGVVVCDENKCKYGCFCKDGFYRNNLHECVTIEQCESVCPKGEIYKPCGTACQATCDDRNPSCTIDCVRNCYCREGFVRQQEGGPCIKFEKCPKGCKGDPNAEFVKCPDPCPATCANGGHKPKVCPALCLLNGCQCLPGFVLDDEGKCILLDDCPPKGCGGDPNAHSGCGLNCGRSCADYKDPPCDCDTRIGCIHNGCDCNDGYVKDSNLNRCVKPDECTPQCGPGENFVTCDVVCPTDFCPKKDEPPLACALPEPCNKPGCKCAFNFRRAKNGTCIPTRDCPPFKCPGKNEVFDACPPICPSEDCADSKLNGVCPFKILIILECNPRCRCAEGFFRDKNHACIPASCCPDA